MKYNFRILLFFSLLALIGISISSFVLAQEDSYRLGDTEVFGELRRPAVEFSHEIHVDALEDLGCGACHHAPDENTGELVYVEDEEVSCSECHGRKEDDATPALREAFHGNCTACHRKMIKEKDNFKGPTTCGECHVPEKDPTRQ
jgi:hypothetical protein